MTVDRETVKCSRRSVKIGGSGGPGRGEEGSIDDRRKSLDTSILNLFESENRRDQNFERKKKEDKSNSTHGNDEGGRGGSSGTEVKTRIVGGNEKSSDEYTEDVEEENSNVNLKFSIERVRFSGLHRE